MYFTQIILLGCCSYYFSNLILPCWFFNLYVFLVLNCTYFLLGFLNFFGCLLLLLVSFHAFGATHQKLPIINWSAVIIWNYIGKATVPASMRSMFLHMLVRNKHICKFQERIWSFKTFFARKVLPKHFHSRLGSAARRWWATERLKARRRLMADGFRTAALHSWTGCGSSRYCMDDNVVGYFRLLAFWFWRCTLNNNFIFSLLIYFLL